MKRIHARALVLVNWRGVFYEHYDLDEHVTAFEGVNGSGKTTVLIAAYLVLLPDLGRLRFTNLGEHAATGGDRGIYGRLGDDGSPSYAVLDFDLPRGQRLLAGVQLQRRTDPTLELRPFIVTDLDKRVALEDVLLLARDDVHLVPDLPQMREQCAMRGGHLKLFDGPKDYLAALFERGVTPMKLGTEEERAKFNDMLRTSMVGGISKALQGGLRDFLLREDVTLGETLRRVRDNLEACRRSRRQVSEAVDLERDIESVYRSGAAMYQAAVLATREREREARDRLDDARARSDRANAHMDVLTEALASARDLQASAQAAKEAADARASRAIDVLQRTRAAHEMHLRILNLESEVEERRVRLTGAQGDAEQASGRLREAEQRHQRAMDEHDRAARGLAELRSGLQELERKAYLHEEVTARVARLGDALPPEPSNDDVRVARQHAETERALHDREIIACERELATAEARRAEHEEVLGALRRLDPRAETYDEALAVLAALREDERVAASEAQVLEALREARVRAARQAEVRGLAARWATVQRPLATAEDVRAAFHEADIQVATHHQELGAAIQALSESDLHATRLGTDIEALQVESAERASVEAAVVALGDLHDRPLQGRTEIETLRGDLAARRFRLEREREALEAGRDALLADAARFEDAGGAFPSTLVAAAETVGGDLLAAHFEEVPIEEAGLVQAMLGPLAEAVLVDDVAQAARRLVATDARPDTLWLVARDGVPHLDEGGERAGDSLLVHKDGTGRLTRLPAAPTIGRRARAERIAALRAQAEQAAAQVLERTAEVRACDAAAADVERVMPRLHLLETAHPGPRLEAARADLARAQTRGEQARARVQAASEALPEWAARRSGLAEMLPHAHLLDSADGAKEVERLLAEREASRAAAERVRRCATDRRVVEERRDVLRHPPPTADALEAWHARKRAADGGRDAAEARVRDLAFCGDNLQALRWTDAAEALRAQKSLAPTLDEQVRLAREEAEQARAACAASQQDERRTQDVLARARADLGTAEASLAGERERLAGTGCADPTESGVREAERLLEEAEAARARCIAEERDRFADVVRCEAQVSAHEGLVDRLQAEADDAEREWRPAAERRERLEQRLAAAGETVPIAPVGRSSINLWSEASAERKALVMSLAHAEGGPPLAETLRARFEEAVEDSGEACLEAWLEVRAWLRRRIPATITEQDDPVAALIRVRDHLARLRDALTDQERRLRTDSVNIARSIQVSRRRASTQVEALNVDLRRVGFGNIAALQIRVEHEARMDQLLARLQEDGAQRLLFEAERPIEEAMAELFRQVGGGRDSGHRLLDYREYMQLRVEVRRQGRSDWEEANPIHLSTGEAIGVGAAVMMVVLAAWERDAALLKRSTSVGTLRMLFLDEANRLSHDNLGVLFDLCRTLELQLLIAAPEVAHGEGVTTYHLVRQPGPQGREVVMKSGRRYARDGAVARRTRSGVRAATVEQIEERRVAVTAEVDALELDLKRLDEPVVDARDWNVD